MLTFGVASGPATFQGAMNHTLKPVARVCALVFFGDISMFSKSFFDHIQDLTQVLQLLRANQWKTIMSKCSFAQWELSYLGFVISEQGISTKPKKILRVQQWPLPHLVKKLWQFLGLSAYYRKLFDIMASLLNH